MSFFPTDLIYNLYHILKVQNIFVLDLILHCFDDCHFMFDIWWAPLPIVFFQKILAISVYFLFQMNFRINMSSSIKNPFGILIGSALNLQINLGRIDIFTLLNLPIQEHGMPLHFFRCSFMSFSKVLSFFSCRSYIFLVRFTPGYFVVFVVIVNYIFSSILHFIFQLVIATV